MKFSGGKDLVNLRGEACWRPGEPDGGMQKAGKSAGVIPHVPWILF